MTKGGKIFIPVTIAGLLISFQPGQDLNIEDKEVSVIVILKKELSSLSLKEFEKQGAKLIRNYEIVPGFSAKVSKDKLKELAKLQMVEKIYLNKPVRALLNESVPQISADKVWSKGIIGSGVKVCLVDTGVDYNHSALAGKVIGQIDIINNDVDAMDDQGHGTWVAGAVVSNNSTYKGVAPGASLLVAKVLDASGSGTYDSVIAGIDWCVSQGADVINISLGGETFTGTCDNDPLAIAVNNAAAQGIVISVSAGNEGIYGLTTPGCASQVIAVGAVDKSGYVPWWSSEGSELDILAPGVNIKSLYPDNKYANGDGTSISSPHISGVAALLLNAKPTASVNEIKQAMYSTASLAPGCYECRWFWRGKCYGAKLTQCDPEDVGAGIVNAYQAYLKIQSIEPPEPEPEPEPEPSIMCWDGNYQYLYRNNSQARKFCKCAQGSYGYNKYSRKWTRARVYYYLDTGNNENWELSSRTSYMPIYQVTCTDNKTYPTNQDYYYPKGR